MCTSIVVNKKKTIVGWNLDLLDMEHRVRVGEHGVYIEINDAAEGWMPLFGANDRGDFVGMPTCWPYDAASEPAPGQTDVVHLDIDLLLQKKTFDEIREIAATGKACSIPGVTFMPALSDVHGNVLYIIPGQGYCYKEKPVYSVMTNFSPFKMDREKHPWMGWDRYQKAVEMLEETDDDFSVEECFRILQTVAQTVCPTVVSMVFDVSEMTVYWCENRDYENIQKVRFSR